MDLSKLKAISKNLDADLEAVFQKYGLKIDRRSASVNPIDGSVRFTIATSDINLTDATGAATTPEAERFKAYATVYGLDPTWLGATMRIGANSYEVMGLRNTKGAKCVSIRRADGKMFVTTMEEVKLRMKAKAAA